MIEIHLDLQLQPQFPQSVWLVGMLVARSAVNAAGANRAVAILDTGCNPHTSGSLADWSAIGQRPTLLVTGLAGPRRPRPAEGDAIHATMMEP